MSTLSPASELATPSAMQIATEDELEENLSRPPASVLEDLARIDGDLLVVGAGGKMGPTLARMARRAFEALGSRHQVVAVARFSEERVQRALTAVGVETVACDLLDRAAVAGLPDAAAVVFMAGAKFGTRDAAAHTWATNCLAAANVAERYVSVPTVVLSTGNVYPLVPVDSGGATELTPPAPIGEYAQSALARERLFEFYAERHRTPTVLFRLNYAVELRYGVLCDVASKVQAGVPVDLHMGYVNCIWQRDANAAALRCLALASVPPTVLNVTGTETLSVRALAERFGERLGRRPVFSGEEEPTALLSNAALAAKRLGPPATAIDTAIDWVADWVRRGGRTLAKPTHFETRDGRF
jgi:nucleoside-diphosphate-sugar epimerase